VGRDCGCGWRYGGLIGLDWRAGRGPIPAEPGGQRPIDGFVPCGDRVEQMIFGAAHGWLPDTAERTRPAQRRGGCDGGFLPTGVAVIEASEFASQGAIICLVGGAVPRAKQGDHRFVVGDHLAEAGIFGIGPGIDTFVAQGA
jgi:hypothetical protein